ncbi:MAG TPA: glutamate racemase [Verrucomicrobiae bacterium]|jgi:glutamate racemase|nr:glutamate racemase [Verrucomicrobiae bacterium]
MNSSELPIGIFDSGIGGLTVVRQIRRVLPHEDLVYLGDTARVPYGTKSPSTVVRFSCEDTRFLLQQNVKAVVVACNTASAWALPTLQERFEVPIFGVILPGVRAALERTHAGRIGVIGTGATIRSKAYSNGLLARNDAVKVFARACPLLVPLVEEGWLNHRVTREILGEYLGPLRRRRIDTLILGCTHYPLLKPAIRAVLGRGVALVDSAESCARFVRERLEHLQLLLRSRRRRAGVIQPFVTDEPDRFAEFARRFLGCPTEPAWKVDLAVADATLIKV